MLNSVNKKQIVIISFDVFILSNCCNINYLNNSELVRWFWYRTLQMVLREPGSGEHYCANIHVYV